jgi:hypothetical protein
VEPGSDEGPLPSRGGASDTTAWPCRRPGDSLPAPENGFRSLTRYDADYLFVPNEPDRYTRSLRFDFTYNADAVLDPYIQKNSPGCRHLQLWLN